MATPHHQEWRGLYYRVWRELWLPSPLCAAPAYALRSAVGTLSLSTRATVPQPGLFSCAFVGKLNEYWLVCVMSVDNELLRVSVEPAVGAALKCVLCLCLCRTASLRNSRNIKDAYIGPWALHRVCRSTICIYFCSQPVVLVPSPSPPPPSSQQGSQ